MRLYHGVACMHFFPLPFLVCLYVYIDNKCVSCLAQMVSLFILRLPMRSAVPFLILPPYVATKFIKDLLHLGTGNALTKQQMHRDSVILLINICILRYQAAENINQTDILVVQKNMNQLHFDQFGHKQQLYHPKNK